MPNDFADWTRGQNSQIVGRAPTFTPLGDVTSPSLAADSVTETFYGQNLNDHAGVVASFKAVVGQAIARVGALGAFLVGANTTITPTFGQATTAGNLLVAWVTAGTSAINSGSGGWVEIFNGGVNDNVSIWAKPNCGAAEAAPTFTCVGATIPMMAQLGEFSGAVTVNPQENSGGYASPPIADPMTVLAAAADALSGDLLLCATAWRTTVAGTATFVDVYNNQATAVAAGNSGSVSRIAHSNFSYAIIPAIVGAQPLGVADWDYDVAGRAAPAAGSQASVVLAASGTKTYRCATMTGSCAQSAATATQRDWELLDGATVIFTRVMGVDVTAGHSDGFALAGLAYKGTAGNSMTFRANSADVGVYQRVSFGAYLR